MSRNCGLIICWQNNWYPACLEPDSVTDRVFSTGTIFRLEEQGILRVSIVNGLKWTKQVSDEDVHWVITKQCVFLSLAALWCGTKSVEDWLLQHKLRRENWELN